MKRAPSSEPKRRKAAALAVEKARRRKYPSGSIGYRAPRCSHPRKAATDTVPTTSAASTSALPQPASGARTGAQARPVSPTAANTSPTRSS